MPMFQRQSIFLSEQALTHKTFKNVFHAKQQQASVFKMSHLQLQVSILRFSTHFTSIVFLSERIFSEKNMDFDQIRPEYEFGNWLALRNRLNGLNHVMFDVNVYVFHIVIAITVFD